MPAVSEAKGAVSPGAPQLFDHIAGNLVFDWDNDVGDAKATEAAFAKAARVVALDPVNVPSAANPFGVKGAGEAGAVGGPPAVINAIVDTLHRRAGLRHIDMPATPQRVWEALNVTITRA